MAAVSDDMVAMRYEVLVEESSLCGDWRGKGVSTGGVRARPWWILDTACLWGTTTLLTCNHNWQERNGVTGVRELSQKGSEARMRPSS